MKPEQLEDLLFYRIEQAHETLREAEILLNESALRGAINRAYYAMFYALLALLATKQLGTSKHSGALALFDREFVKAGVFPRELSRSLHLAFDRRHCRGDSDGCQSFCGSYRVVLALHRTSGCSARSRRMSWAHAAGLLDRAPRLGHVGITPQLLDDDFLQVEADRGIPERAQSQHKQWCARASFHCIRSAGSSARWRICRRWYV